MFDHFHYLIHCFCIWVRLLPFLKYKSIKYWNSYVFNVKTNFKKWSFIKKLLQCNFTRIKSYELLHWLQYKEALLIKQDWIGRSMSDVKMISSAKGDASSNALIEIKYIGNPLIPNWASKLGTNDFLVCMIQGLNAKN